MSDALRNPAAATLVTVLIARSADVDAVAP